MLGPHALWKCHGFRVVCANGPRVLSRLYYFNARLKRIASNCKSGLNCWLIRSFNVKNSYKLYLTWRISILTSKTCFRSLPTCSESHESKGKYSQVFLHFCAFPRLVDVLKTAVCLKETKRKHFKWTSWKAESQKPPQRGSTISPTKIGFFTTICCTRKRNNS